LSSNIFSTHFKVSTIFWKCKRKQKFVHSVGPACYGRPGPVGNQPTGTKPPARTGHLRTVVAQRSAVTRQPRCGGSSGGSTREGKVMRRAREGAEELTKHRGNGKAVERAQPDSVQQRRRGCGGRRQRRRFPTASRSGGDEEVDQPMLRGSGEGSCNTPCFGSLNLSLITILSGLGMHDTTWLIHLESSQRHF
jgi:hypothetical protein